MNLEVGKFYENKTKIYLLPCLTAYGENFISRFNKMYKFAVGIHDSSFHGHKITEDSLFYIMFDKVYSKPNFQSFLNWLKNEPYYVMDYVSGSELDSRKHMIVLRFPEKYEEAYAAFLKGHFSKMFTEEDKNLLFKEEHRKKALKVLNKTEDALLDYVAFVNREFEYSLTKENCRDHGEYSFPNIPIQEIFNYSEHKSKEFNTKYAKSWIETSSPTLLV